MRGNSTSDWLVTMFRSPIGSIGLSVRDGTSVTSRVRSAPFSHAPVVIVIRARRSSRYLPLPLLSTSKSLRIVVWPAGVDTRD